MHDLVDLNNVEPETFGPNGFANPQELLNWLKNNRSDEDIVLTHGDYCLPHIFVKENEISGFIDNGKMGPADRWQDIAIVIRSLKHNFDGRYTDGKKIFDFKLQMFLDVLGVILIIENTNIIFCWTSCFKVGKSLFSYKGDL